MDIAERIHQLCEKKDIKSIYELAKITKVPQSTLQSILSGHSPKTDTVQKICNGLGITMAEFFTDFDLKKASEDVLPALLETMQTLDLPQELKDAATKKFHTLSDNQKQVLTAQLVKSSRVAEGHTYYTLDSSIDPEVLNKYKSLPEESRKALDTIIKSLHSRSR